MEETTSNSGSLYSAPDLGISPRAGSEGADRTPQTFSFHSQSIVPGCFSVAVIKPRNKLGRKRFIWLSGYTASSGGAKRGTQEGSLAGNQAKLWTTRLTFLQSSGPLPRVALRTVGQDPKPNSNQENAPRTRPKTDLAEVVPQFRFHCQCSPDSL